MVDMVVSIKAGLSLREERWSAAARCRGTLLMRNSLLPVPYSVK